MAIKTSRHNVRQSSHNVYELWTQHHTNMMKTDQMYLCLDITQFTYTDNEEKNSKIFFCSVHILLLAF